MKWYLTSIIIIHYNLGCDKCEYAALNNTYGDELAGSVGILM